MPKNAERKRKKWNADSMKRAVIAVREIPGKSLNVKRGRPAGKATVITSSTYKKSLEEQLEKTKAKEQKKFDTNKQQLPKIAEKFTKKSVNQNNKETKKETKNKSQELNKKTVCKKQLLFKEVKKTKVKTPSICDSSDEDMAIPYVSTDDEDSADEECVYCCQPYKNDASGEQWIRCIRCLRWAHDLCSGYEKSWKTFTCDFCRQN